MPQGLRRPRRASRAGPPRPAVPIFVPVLGEAVPRPGRAADAGELAPHDAGRALERVEAHAQRAVLVRRALLCVCRLLLLLLREEPAKRGIWACCEVRGERGKRIRG
jgi:hypothetical protein